MGEVDALTRTVWSSVAYVCAYATGVALFAWMARRRGLGTEGIRILAQAALVGGLVTAVFVQFVTTGGPGRTIVGAFAGGYLAVVLAKRVLGIRRPTGDLFAVAFAGGEAVGRIGCFIGGCCYGKVAHVAWATFDHGAPRHPTQLYSSVAAAATLALLLWLDRFGLPENALFYVQGVSFCVARFVIEFYRDGSPAAGPLTLAQAACVVGFAFFAYRLLRLAVARGTRRTTATVRRLASSATA